MSLPRPVRNRTIATRYTPSKTPRKTRSAATRVRQHSYALDQPRAVTKKLAAASKELDFEIIFKQSSYGLEFSASAYEVFKQVLITHFESDARVHDTVIRLTENRIDSNGANSDDSISICPGDTLALELGSRKQLYRINLYHTTSRVEVNGHMRERFLDELDVILTILDNNVNFHALNAQIRRRCEEYLSRPNEVQITQGPHKSLLHSDPTSPRPQPGTSPLTIIHSVPQDVPPYPRGPQSQLSLQSPTNTHSLHQTVHSSPPHNITSQTTPYSHSLLNPTPPHTTTSNTLATHTSSPAHSVTLPHYIHSNTLAIHHTQASAHPLTSLTPHSSEVQLSPQLTPPSPTPHPGAKPTTTTSSDPPQVKTATKA
jgi:hypothetical protein